MRGSLGNPSSSKAIAKQSGPAPCSVNVLTKKRCDEPVVSRQPNRKLLRASVSGKWGDLRTVKINRANADALTPQ